MSFVEVCWLIVKICAGIIAVMLALGFTAKLIAKNRKKKEEDESDFSIHG